MRSGWWFIEEASNVQASSVALSNDFPYNRGSIRLAVGSEGISQAVDVDIWLITNGQVGVRRLRTAVVCLGYVGGQAPAMMETGSPASSRWCDQLRKGIMTEGGSVGA